MSKEWRNAWGDLPKTTQFTIAETSVYQLQWSFDAGIMKNHIVCERIAQHCGVEVLQCAYSNGCRLSDAACSKAAARENFAMIQ